MIPRKYLQKLKMELAGTLLEAGDPGYDQSLVIDNGRIDLRPGVVVMCANAQDVATAYKFTIEHEMPFTVRGGGHSAAGYCLNQGGMVIDLTNMTAKRLDLDRQVVWTETGNRWRDLYLFLQATNTGLIPIGGGCPTVGIPGFMLGGGISFVSRSYGLSVDNLLSIDLVTPDGKLRRISAESKSKEDRDLWWACRGGGGGNFGIAVAFELRVHQPNTPTMLCGQIRYPIEYAQEVLGFYNEWIEKAPDSLAVYGYMGKVALPAHPDTLVNTVRSNADLQRRQSRGNGSDRSDPQVPEHLHQPLGHDAAGLRDLQRPAHDRGWNERLHPLGLHGAESVYAVMHRRADNLDDECAVAEQSAGLDAHGRQSHRSRSRRDLLLASRCTVPVGSESDLAADGSNSAERQLGVSTRRRNGAALDRRLLQLHRSAAAQLADRVLRRQLQAACAKLRRPSIPTITSASSRRSDRHSIRTASIRPILRHFIARSLFDSRWRRDS